VVVSSKVGEKPGPKYLPFFDFMIGSPIIIYKSKPGFSHNFVFSLKTKSEKFTLSLVSRHSFSFQSRIVENPGPKCSPFFDL